MSRWALSLLLVVALASTASASLHTFTKNWADAPDFTVLKSDFELDDMPTTPGGSFFHTNFSDTAIISLNAEQFDLETVGVGNEFVSLTFVSPGGLVWMTFQDVAGASAGGSLPDFTSDGAYQRWLPAPGVTKMNATIAAVPEPSALGFGAIAVGLVGVGRVIRRRFRKAT